MAKTIIHDESGKTWFGNEDHLLKSQSAIFPELIFELLSERTPTRQEFQLFNLILNLSIDHGPDTPSAVATIQAAKEGKSFGEAVGAGVAEINERHGGAIEPMMEIIYRLHGSHSERSEESSKVMEAEDPSSRTPQDDRKLKVRNLVKDYLRREKRIPGLGHRIYKDKDPRAELIFQTAASLNIGEGYIQIVKEIRDELERQSGKSLVVNIDGAIAAVLCSFNWPSKLGKAVFIVARTPGLCSHYLNTTA